MAATVKNWFGDLVQQPAKVVMATSVEDIVAVLTDPGSYPAPVRAIGSNHSTTKCGIADGGTLVNVSQMTKIIKIDAAAETVTAQAGALYIDVAEALAAQGLQFFVNVELGNLTLGSAATGGTKDSSMPGEFGQVCSYAVEVKLVKPNGELATVTEDDGELMQIMRSSYGLMGIAYEVTFRVQKLRSMQLRHKVYKLDDFIQKLPELKAQGDSMMFFLFPFLDRIGVEFRRYNESPETKGRWQWKLRNWVWATAAPGYARFVGRYVPGKKVKHFCWNIFSRAATVVLGFIRGKATNPLGQIIRYPHTGGFTSYTFSIWAFPEASFPEILRGYYDFCRSYYDKTGYRCDMGNVGYRISKDQSPLFSYTFDGDVMTLDPVSTGQQGWDDFLIAYNRYCSDAGGVPLFNQTKHITPAQSKKAFGDRLDKFERYRTEWDPEERLLNLYFKERLSV